jgi:hypothetical protein
MNTIARATGILIAIFLPTAVALAFDVPSALTGAQYTIQTSESATGISLQTVLAASGLNTQRYAPCTSTQLLGELANIFKNFKSILQDEINNAIQDFYTTILQSLTKCALADVSLPIPFSGGDTNPLPKCRTIVSSDMKVTLQRLKERETQSSLIAGCISRIAMKDTGDMVNSMMQQQGPFGEGPAWVTSWENLPKQERERAKARFYAILVNTHICPYMRDQMYAYFRVPKSYIDAKPSLAGSIETDGDDPFILRARCTLPDDFSPENAGAITQNSSYLALVDLMNQPQNNPQGFLDMATAELNGMTADLIQARMADATSGGGVESIADCIQWSPDGRTCLAAGPNKQTGGTLKDFKAAITQAEIDRLNSQQQAVDDITSSIANHLFDLANHPLPLHLELSPNLNPEKFASTPPPTITPLNPICATIQSPCVCIADDIMTREALAPRISDAIARAIQTNAECFTNGTNQITFSSECPDNRYVLQAICDRLQGQFNQVCQPSSTSDTQIVLVGGGGPSLSIDVITPDGYVRTDGGQPVAACPAGIQD